MSAFSPEAPHAVVGHYDPTVMLERIGGDMQLFVELVSIFQEDYPPLLEEIRRAVADNDAARLKMAAHTLRGAIGNFTVASPYDLAKHLEVAGQTNNFDDASTTVRLLTDSVEQLCFALQQSVPCSNSQPTDGS